MSVSCNPFSCLCLNVEQGSAKSTCSESFFTHHLRGRVLLMAHQNECCASIPRWIQKASFHLYSASSERLSVPSIPQVFRVHRTPIVVSTRLPKSAQPRRGYTRQPVSMD